MEAADRRLRSNLTLLIRSIAQPSLEKFFAFAVVTEPPTTVSEPVNDRFAHISGPRIPTDLSGISVAWPCFGRGSSDLV